jgi:2-polyprenyl-3-methyl-5-hydroxy-6-metoxy-1,4-benzoquinol methylase
MPIDDDVKDIWNANAEFWDSKMGEGNDFHKTLIEPVQLNLLNIQKNDKILDIACGNGQFSRKMNQLGAQVTAIDLSDTFIEISRQKSDKSIDFKVIDVTKIDELKSLDDLLFDSIVCTMALMDIENIEVLIEFLPRILKENGKFVFSVLHPCFNSSENILSHEQDESGGEVKNKYFVKISNYLVEKSYMGIGMVGQPRPQYYFHRSISSLLNVFLKNGFYLDALEEPSFNKIENADTLFLNVFNDIPPALICRLRRANTKTS